MNTISSLTIWIILATIIPGLITIACILIILFWVFPNYSFDINLLSNWGGFSIAVSVMIVTQLFGIVKQRFLKLLFPKTIEVYRISKSGMKTKTINAADEYKYLYTTISSFSESEDRHGHIQRIIGQFFLTMNSLVSLFLGILVVIVLLIVSPEILTFRVITFLTISILLYSIIFFALRERYCTMIKSLYSVRHSILKRMKKAC